METIVGQATDAQSAGFDPASHGRRQGGHNTRPRLPLSRAHNSPQPTAWPLQPAALAGDEDQTRTQTEVRFRSENTPTETATPTIQQGDPKTEEITAAFTSARMALSSRQSCCAWCSCS